MRSLSDYATLANFAQNLQEGIYITNETGEILDANSAFLEIFGIPSIEDTPVAKRAKAGDSSHN